MAWTTTISNLPSTTIPWDIDVIAIVQDWTTKNITTEDFLSKSKDYSWWLILDTTNTFTDSWILANRVFTDSTARDTAITTPSNWMLCYQTDVQDYFAYKNGIWTQWLWWGWWTATYYQDSTNDWTLTWDLDWANTDFVLTSWIPWSMNQVQVVKNGIVMELWASDDYTITWQTITFNTAPIADDKIVVFYSSAPVWTWNAKSAATTAIGSDIWELFRNTDDNQDLYYKDADWNTLKIHDKATNKIPESSVNWNFAITWELKLWTTDTAPTWWLISNWAEVSRTTYANLFNVIWETYWAWDWSTTFNLPNLSWNVPVWKDWNTFANLADTWWNENVWHTHIWWWLYAECWPISWGSTIWFNSRWSWTLSRTNNTSSNESWNYTWQNFTAVNWETWNSDINVIQPYIVINYIIKT